MNDNSDEKSRMGQRMLDNVLNGKSAQGQPHKGPMPFSKDKQVRAAAALILEMTTTGVELTDDHQLTAIARKLFSHFHRTGQQTVDSIFAFPARNLIDALTRRPEFVRDGSSIRAILADLHQHTCVRRIALLRSNDIPSRKLIWRERDWRLEEATDPRHLEDDSAALGHCTGILVNERMKKEANDPSKPDREFLRYWLRITSKRSRIFTLTHKFCPVYTMEMDLRLNAISDLSGRRGEHIQNGDLPMLCQALTHLRRHHGLAHISDFINMDQAVLTADGRLVRDEDATTKQIQHAVSGNLRLQCLSPDRREAALASSFLTLNIDELDNDSLAVLTDVECVLKSHADKRLSNLRRGRVRALTGGELHLPSFESGSVGTLARVLKLPVFENGNLAAHNAAKLHLPEHRHGQILATDLVEGWFPKQETGRIFVPKIRKIYLPVFKHGEFVGPGRNRERHWNGPSRVNMELHLPAHETGSVDTFATKVRLPNHRSGDVSALFAETIEVPNFEEGRMVLSHAQEVALPKHRYGHLDICRALVRRGIV